ncbi:inositol monophosphatase family protein [Microbacterium aoyamense]|uniref:inositol monophosphatase family protein n=1 Tax=Microbacterium aoyamense TaxID=344166 RepID=UPI0020037E19|nr:inositol monophosphatase family protein [Microbacterium aoyamense]
MTSPSAAASFDAPYEGDLHADLDLALWLADAADAASMPRFDAPDLDVQAKPDATFVTDADLATEEAIRAILAAERPDDSVLGEEFGTTGDSNRQWIIDPIDGTHNYLKGIPMWTTLIALAIDGVPRVGVVSQPAIGRRWWAASGLGAWTNGPKRIAVSTVAELDKASVSFQSIEQWRDAGELDALERLTSSVWRDRGYGDAWPYMLLAEGRLELVAEFGVKEYDIAALIPIVTEAGGKFSAYSGADSLSERSSLATNRVLHQTFLDLLHPS